MKESAFDNQSVQFSRTEGIPSVIALGGSVLIALALFVAGGPLIQQCGADTPIVYFIAAILFLPIALSCAQRSSGGIANANFYSAARSSGSALRLFFTVWLMLGGYVALAALLVFGAATRLSIGLNRVFGVNIGMEQLVIITVGAAFVKEILTRRENWRSRTVTFWVCTIFLLALAIAGILGHYRAGTTVPKPEPAQHWLLAVSMLASSLWSIDIVLNYRGQFRKPTRTTIWSLLAIFCGFNLFSGIVSMVIVNNPALLMQNWLAALSWNESRLELLILITAFILCMSGFMRVMTRITRLLGSMILDGSLPGFSDKHEKAVRLYSVLFFALLAFLAAWLSVTYLLLTTAFASLLSVILYLYPLLQKKNSRIAEFSLPLHPLVPALSIGLAIFLMFILPLPDLLIGALWMLVGTILYFGLARKKLLPMMQKEHTLAFERVKSGISTYSVLACLDNEKINEGLIRIGAAIAASKNGELLVLRILETSELLPANVQRKQGEIEWNRISEFLKNVPLPGAIVLPVVRMAPDPISGIQATCREFNVDFVLVEWPKEKLERSRKSKLQNLLQLTARPLGIVKGQIYSKPNSISIACGTNAHTLLALQIGEMIAARSESVMKALKIFTKSESKEDAYNIVQDCIRQSAIRFPHEVHVYGESNAENGILKHSQESELLVLGVSDDPLSGSPLPDGIAMEIANHRKPATLIIKSKEETSTFLRRRFMVQLTKWFTPLTPKEKSELMGQLKVGLQARTDFYMMVILAAAIAITGLIMNDGSIVLGAMLVSPLMGPIVGIACGIALGNTDLMRRSGGSTFKGMALVLGVGVVMTFLLPRVYPTEQILSRTHPGIFDLLAALAAGAAGAYSLGKKSVAGAIPGVAMSLSLEPPLATAGYGLSTSQFWITGGALLLFMTNLAAIVLSGVGVYLLLGMRPPKKEGLYVVGKSVGAVILVTFALIVPLGVGTYGSVQRGHLKFQVESQFRTEALNERFQLLDLKILEQEEGFLIQPTVLSSEEVTPEQIERFRKAVEQKIGSPIQIDATILKTKRIESPGNTKDKM